MFGFAANDGESDLDKLFGNEQALQNLKKSKEKCRTKNNTKHYIRWVVILACLGVLSLFFYRGYIEKFPEAIQTYQELKQPIVDLFIYLWAFSRPIFWFIVLAMIFAMVVCAWERNRIAGISVAIVCITILTTYYVVTHKKYVEPSIDQPHAELKILVENVNWASRIFSFTIKIDGREVDVSQRRILFHNGIAVLSIEGEYPVRVTPHKHQMRLSYDAIVPGGVEFTAEDLKYSFTVSTGQKLYLLLNLGYKISLKRISKEEYQEMYKYLQKDPHKRVQELYQKLLEYQEKISK